MGLVMGIVCILCSTKDVQPRSWEDLEKKVSYNLIAVA